MSHRNSNMSRLFGWIVSVYALYTPEDDVIVETGRGSCENFFDMFHVLAVAPWNFWIFNSGDKPEIRVSPPSPLEIGTSRITLDGGSS